MNDPVMTRRRLLALGGSGMMLATLGACGGGGGDEPAPPVNNGGGGGGGGGGGVAPSFAGNGAAGAGTPGAAVNAALRMATLDAVASELNTLAGSGLRFDSTVLATRLLALPGLHRVGISSRMQNVWARFTDGRSLVVPNNLDPAPAVATAAAPLALARRPATLGRAHALGNRARPLAAGTDLPALLVRQQYRQLDMLGRVPLDDGPLAHHLCQDWVSGQTLPNLCRMALGRGFTLPALQAAVPPDQGMDNGVEGLRSVRGDGVFFITACAAQVGSSEAPTTVICTATRASEVAEDQYALELAAGTLAYAVVRSGDEGVWSTSRLLAITPAFMVANGWSFPPECLAILNLSGGSVLAEWESPLRAAGLRNLLIWEQPVPWQRMLAFMDDLIQIELGTNNLDGTYVTEEKKPRLRAYGVGATTQYLVGRGQGSQALYLPERLEPEFVSVLLPTIDYVSVDEANELLEVVGQFGRQVGSMQEPGVPELRVGGQPGRFSEPLLARASDAPLEGYQAAGSVGWWGNLLQASLRFEDLEQGGFVQVVNGGRCSNVVPITHWEVPLQMSSTVTGGLRLALTVTLHLRADVRGYRLNPRGERNNGNEKLSLMSARRSRAEFQANGQISRTVESDTTTVSWSGGGRFQHGVEGDVVLAVGLLDWPLRRFAFQVTVQGSGRYSERTLVERTDSSGKKVISDVTEPQPVSLAAPLDATQVLAFEFDDKWALKAGQLNLADEPVTVLGARTRSTVLSWATVEPHFPPEEDVGGV